MRWKIASEPPSHPSRPSLSRAACQSLQLGFECPSKVSSLQRKTLKSCRNELLNSARRPCSMQMQLHSLRKPLRSPTRKQQVAKSADHVFLVQPLWQNGSNFCWCPASPAAKAQTDSGIRKNSDLKFLWGA